MQISVDLILWLCAAVSFGLGAFSIKGGRLNWLCLGLMFAALTFLFN